MKSKAHSFGEDISDCPVCETEFDSDTWDHKGVVMHIARYECPECGEGNITIGP